MAWVEDRKDKLLTLFGREKKEQKRITSLQGKRGKKRFMALLTAAEGTFKKNPDIQRIEREEKKKRRKGEQP